MVSSDFRAEARSRLKGKWGKVASISLAYFAIVFVISFVESMLSDTLASVFSIALTVINVPFSFGLIYAFFKVSLYVYRGIFFIFVGFEVCFNFEEFILS